MTRTTGIIILLAGVGLLVVGSVFLVVSLSGGGMTAGGAALGFAILFVVAAPVIGGGVFAMARGRQEASEQVEAEKQRKILDMVQARGQISVSDVIIELQSDLQSVQDMLYKLVGMGVFSGYINWDEGTLYSAEASELHAIQQCKNCGGDVNFAGKGVQQCPYCGTEYFLAK